MLVFVVSVRFFIFFETISEQHVGHPRDHGQRGHGGEGHSQRDIGGHGGHVRSHHAGDEKEWGERDNDRQRGHDDRRQYFLHRFEGCIKGVARPGPDMPLDIVHIGNGIIHHQPQGKDEREQGDAIDGVVEQVVDEQGQGKTHGDGKGNHHGLTPAKGECQERHHGQDGEK